MKKFKYHILGICVLFAGLVIFFACEDRLDKQPLGDTEVTFFTTQDNFDRGIQGIYAKLTDWYWFNSNDCAYDFWLLPGDDITTRQDRVFESFSAFQPSGYKINFYWEVAYKIIGRANVMLDQIEKVPDGIYVDADLKNWHRGEALFLRGLVFYRIWSYYGTAPVVTTRISGIGDQTKPAGSTGTQMLDQAIADLTEAATLLPDGWEDKFIGRATANAAYGLLGKCYITRACYGGGATDYTAAIAAFNSIQNVQLTPHFGSNFDAMDENNEESLFEFQAGTQAAGGENIWLNNDFNQQIGSMSAYWGFFDNAWSWWGQPPFVPTDKLRNAFETGDPRIDETFRPNDGTNYNGWEFIKYTKRNNMVWHTASLNNPRILRYADVLLMRAEAYLQTGNTAAALADVNAIRERARNSVPDGNPPSAVPADLATVTMQDIMDERFRELAGEEGYRFLDLKRWHAAAYINLSSWSTNDWGPSLRGDFDFAGWFSSTQGKMLYPIPTNEIDLNPNIVQNTGY